MLSSLLSRGHAVRLPVFVLSITLAVPAAAQTMPTPEQVSEPLRACLATEAAKGGYRPGSDDAIRLIKACRPAYQQWFAGCTGAGGSEDNCAMGGLLAANSALSRRPR